MKVLTTALLVANCGLKMKTRKTYKREILSNVWFA